MLEVDVLPAQREHLGGARAGGDEQVGEVPEEGQRARAPVEGSEEVAHRGAIAGASGAVINARLPVGGFVLAAVLLVAAPCRTA